MTPYKILMNDNEKSIAIITKIAMEHNDITLDEAVKRVSELLCVSGKYVKAMWENYFLID